MVKNVLNFTNFMLLAFSCILVFAFFHSLSPQSSGALLDALILAGGFVFVFFIRSSFRICMNFDSMLCLTIQFLPAPLCNFFSSFS